MEWDGDGRFSVGGFQMYPPVSVAYVRREVGRVCVCVCVCVSE